MKKRIILRVVSALLVFVFLFGTFSCSKKENEIEYDDNRRLEIKHEQASYSDEYIANANARFTKITKTLIKLYTDFSYNEKTLETAFTTTFLPILYKVNIYEEELDEIFTLLEVYSEGDKELPPTKPLFLSVYEILLFVLGEERSGKLSYELALKKLFTDTQNYRERFEKYGYAFYKTDADRCAALYNDLKALGESKFTSAVFITTTVLYSIAAASESVDENAFLLTDEELLYILKRHSTNLTERSLKEEEWQIFGGLISEFSSVRPKDLYSAIVYTLNDYTHTDIYDESVPKTLYQSTYFATLMRAMPKVVSLYTDVIKKLNRDGTFSLEASNDEKIISIISALAECEKGIFELDEALHRFGATEDPEYLRETVSKNSDSDELLAFLASYSALPSSDLITALTDMKANATASLDDINELLISYVYGHSPYLAFALYQGTK